ncbi:ribonuclease T1 [Paraburkholderia silvatlantica]|uniref:Ribonuclease T1 n=1 Tax=Paraburkholderia silvatlantica TaxID=321895 RepID=A0ABR6FTQ7_9BURK|nr:ribonuclease [Paraburkholderia silvatlantica]MBB2930813.1 ribonuclease T1 [Paraburkholderia silvatlantica]PVY31966.1 ribonuclease T1 [Paraburkholderia silvatlantica]PXW37537.1 ribonuclease T1 [Paraburkholderia silvatlantica]
MAPRLTHCFGGSLSSLRRAAAVALVATAALAAVGAQARTSQPEEAGNPPGSISVNELPREAVGTLSLIAAGGPFPYEKDGVVFGNFERILPPHRRGYYHEYTVPTPGAHNRGARRIVCGGPRRRTDNCYYSDDHYASFRRIID